MFLVEGANFKLLLNWFVHNKLQIGTHLDFFFFDMKLKQMKARNRWFVYRWLKPCDRPVGRCASVRKRILRVGCCRLCGSLKWLP